MSNTEKTIVKLMEKLNNEEIKNIYESGTKEIKELIDKYKIKLKEEE